VGEARTRKRRWLQFSIRAMLIATTLFCLWFGWTLSAIRERKQLLDELLDWGKEGRLGVIDWNPSALPWYRRALGDTYLAMVEFPPDAPDEMIERVSKTFPEAMVIGKADKP
jgi:hypothetical protein